MKALYRDYQKGDYLECEEMVNGAWSFDTIFKPKSLSTLAKLLYTQGSIVNSNYKRVVEVDGKVVGFIFGRNQNAKPAKRDILFHLKIVFELLFVKSISPDKKTLLQAIATHEKNKSKILNHQESEIVLFVIDENSQGKGYGTKLWQGFRDFCKHSNVTSIAVETNKLGASRFYEKVGFTHLNDFDSPLHEFTTKGGQACLYRFLCAP